MMRKPALILAGIADNAMLYKDITQWLRKRTFAILFFGLLAIAEVTTAIVVLVTQTEERLGVVSFSVLSSVLFLYALIIAFLEHNLTAREFFNRTFELYELSGMSLERMVWGKFLSMLVQFSFGFFCLVPFMFVAFLLGGLDFYLVITVSILLVLAILPLYLMALFVALLGKSKQVSGLIRGVALVLLFLILPYLALGLSYQLVRFGGAGSLVDFFKQLVLLDPSSVKATLYFLAFYLQICLLLFYLCCNAISPSTDSRSTAVHFLTTLLSACYLGAWGVFIFRTAWVDESVGYAVFVPPAILFLILGLASFYGRPDVPVMTRRRRDNARLSLTKVVYALFAPGVKGTLRTLLIFELMFGLFTVLMTTLVSAMVPVMFHFYNAATTALQMPFFLALPGAFLVLSQRFRQNTALLKVGILSWWVILGLPLMITVTVVSSDAPYSYHSFLGELFIQALALHLSPLSSVVVAGDSPSFVFIIAPYRVILGVLGLLALYFTARRRLAYAAKALPKPT
ncbi:MAG: hypothetical protein FJ276_00445 [Planctomycetes bacterium]|nr:hypothetical protein [Planctomycetota bacterium]